MGIAGAAFRASNALEEIVAKRILQQKLEQEVAERQQRMAMEQSRIEEGKRQFDVEAGQRTRQLDAQDTDRRARSNQAGVRRMLGEALVQGDGPMQSQDRRGLAALQVEAGDAPTLLNEPKPERDPIADHEAKLRLEAKYRPPQRPERDPIADYEARLKLDQQYKTNAQGVDPAKAREKGQSMLQAAKSLRSHKGLGSFTGARIGNPDYALGVANEPVAGTQAADAASYFNQLKSLFTLDNIGLLKGVLSDTDMKILQQAATSLNPSMRDETFAAELDNVIQKLEAGLGGSQAGGLAPMAPVSSRGTGGPAPSADVDALIAKYGRKR
jgi:hypothetical protein